MANIKEKSFSDMVQEFLSACGQENPRFCYVDLETQDKLCNLYGKLIDEEYKELLESEVDTAHWVKESCDLIWVIIGRMLVNGVDVNKAFKELARSNMSKTVNGSVIRREDGKILKPETYSDADMTDSLLLNNKDKVFLGDHNG